MYFSDRMAEIIKEDKRRDNFLQGRNSSPLYCRRFMYFNLHTDDIKMEKTGIKGKHDNFGFFITW